MIFEKCDKIKNGSHIFQTHFIETIGTSKLYSGKCFDLPRIWKLSKIILVIIVNDLVSFIHFTGVKDPENVLSRSVNITSKQETGKAVQVVVLVQLVFVTLQKMNILQVITDVQPFYLQQSKRDILQL